MNSKERIESVVTTALMLISALVLFTGLAMNVLSPTVKYSVVGVVFVLAFRGWQLKRKRLRRRREMIAELHTLGVQSIPDAAHE